MNNSLFLPIAIKVRFSRNTFCHLQQRQSIPTLLVELCLVTTSIYSYLNKKCMLNKYHNIKEALRPSLLESRMSCLDNLTSIQWLNKFFVYSEHLNTKLVCYSDHEKVSKSQTPFEIPTNSLEFE
jgi:hypothetical protein